MTSPSTTGDARTEADPTPSPTAVLPPASTPTPPALGEVPAGFTACGATTGGQAVFGNEFTSCPFALNVAAAWSAATDPTFLSAVPSPVTGQTYDMQCRGYAPARCEGGNNAAVLIYP